MFVGVYLEHLFMKLIIRSKHYLSLKYPRSFVNGINPKYAIPTRKTITRRIVSTYASCLNYMKSRLHALDFKISLTYDVWTFFSEFTLRQGYGPVCGRRLEACKATCFLSRIFRIRTLPSAIRTLLWIQFRVSVQILGFFHA
jgi:hypothetical protein